MSQTANASAPEHIDQNRFMRIELLWREPLQSLSVVNMNDFSWSCGTKRNDFSSLNQAVNLPDSVQPAWPIPIPVNLHRWKRTSPFVATLSFVPDRESDV